MRSVVVTGVSTGIGHGTAKVLVEHGFRVYGSVRTQADARRVSQELGGSFTPLVFDVTDQTAVNAEAGRVAAALGPAPLFGLVNNAGIARPGPLLHVTIAEFREQLDVNVTGQLIVTQAFAPLLFVDRAGQVSNARPGRIVMISSVGGKNATPFLGAYNASKFALEGLSECLRRELLLYGVDVIVVAPGAVATAIWDKAEALDVSRIAATPYAAAVNTLRSFAIERGKRGLSEEALGIVVHKALTTPRPKTRYVVTPDRLEHFIVRALPKRTLDRLIAKRLGLSRRRVDR